MQNPLEYHHLPESMSGNYDNPLSATPEFKQFIEDIILYRCLVRRSTYEKYFDTPKGWAVLRQAFVHKSLGIANYELLEFEGDVLLNLAVVECIRARFPNIVSVDWNTRIKHNLISKKTLAELAIKNGFTQHIAYSEQLARRIAIFDDPTECRDYLNMNEDTVEALCGAISQILNENVTRGAGYRACFNLIKSFLDSVEISIKYEEVFDAKSRMKSLFDAQNWNNEPGCRLGDCLRLYTLQDSGGKRGQHEKAMEAYLRALPRGERPDPSILETTDRFLVLGYACLKGRVKTFLAVGTGNKKAEIEQSVADEVIEKLRRKGIWLTPSDPYKRTQ